MNEEEESLIGKIERFLNKDNDVIVTDENIRELLNTIDKYLDLYNKEKEKNKKIDEFCRKELAFEKRLKRENREPDEFNQGRFYVSENIRKIIKEE